jgi:hypothetical protein
MTVERFKRKLRKIRRKGEMYKKEQEVRDVYAEYWPDRKERKTSTVMLVVIVTSIILYTIGAFFIQYHTGVEVSSTLTTCWFSFWGVEILAITGIKISKVFQKSSKDDVA